MLHVDPVNKRMTARMPADTCPNPTSIGLDLLELGSTVQLQCQSKLDLDNTKTMPLRNWWTAVSRRRIFACFISIAAAMARIMTRRKVSPCNAPSIFVGVFTAAGSSAKYVARRNAIRSTWLRDVDPSCNCCTIIRFVVGRSNRGNEQDWQNEIQTHRREFMELDILDSYENLTNKTIAFFTRIGAMRPYEYVLKIDDDQFLSQSHLMKAAIQWSTMGADYVGCMTTGGEVHTDPRECCVGRSLLSL